MSKKQVEQQFVMWNAAGIGSSHLASGNWRFRKTVLFYHEVAYKRFVRDAKGRPLLLIKQQDVEDQLAALPTEKHMIDSKVIYHRWEMPEIGVMSRYEGDLLSEPELHERQKYLLFAQLRHVVEDMVVPLAGKDVDEQAGIILRRVDKMFARIHNYALVFKLAWPEVPKFYRDEVVSALNQKKARYHAPKSVIARERAHARKIAKKAFGIV